LRSVAGGSTKPRSDRGISKRLGAHDVRLLSACCQQHALVLGQQAVPDATNELGAIAPFLAQLPLAGETLTFDAEITHWLVARQVVAQDGAYLMVIKDNQPTLLRACAEATAEQPKRPRRQLGQACTVRLAHGRLEERTLLAVAALPDLGFPYARQVLRLHRRRIHKRTGAVLTDETVYAVTSLSPEQAAPRAPLRLWQRHAKPRATSKPMPALAPVTTAIMPERSGMSDTDQLDAIFILQSVTYPAAQSQRPGLPPACGRLAHRPCTSPQRAWPAVPQRVD
jgi:hypothetical protein